MENSNKKRIAIYIFSMTFGIPAIGSLSKIIGKFFGFFENESVFYITKEYIMLCIATNGLVGVVFLCIGLLLLKDRANTILYKNRDI